MPYFKQTLKLLLFASQLERNRTLRQEMDISRRSLDSHHDSAVYTLGDVPGVIVISGNGSREGAIMKTTEEIAHGVVELDPLNSGEFRKALGHFPSGLTVVTGYGEAGPMGFT